MEIGITYTGMNWYRPLECFECCLIYSISRTYIYWLNPPEDSINYIVFICKCNICSTGNIIMYPQSTDTYLWPLSYRIETIEKKSTLNELLHNTPWISHTPCICSCSSYIEYSKCVVFPIFWKMSLPRDDLVQAIRFLFCLKLVIL